MTSVNLEISINSDIERIKEYLKQNSISYLEDFLLQEVVFVSIASEEVLNPILNFIKFEELNYALLTKVNLGVELT